MLLNTCQHNKHITQNFFFLFKNTGGVDYEQFNQLITLLPTTSRFEFNVTIKSDDLVEVAETFTAELSLDEQGPIIIAQGGGVATIEIEDAVC